MDIRASDLKNGKEFRFTTPGFIDDQRDAHASFNERLSKFCIWFNGALFTFKSFKGFEGKLKQLVKDWDLHLIELEEDLY